MVCVWEDYFTPYAYALPCCLLARTCRKLSIGILTHYSYGVSPQLNELLFCELSAEVPLVGRLRKGWFCGLGLGQDPTLLVDWNASCSL